MALIPIEEYAKKQGKCVSTIRGKCARGMFSTARKLGRDWFIEASEPYIDHRITSGKYIDWRKPKTAR